MNIEKMTKRILCATAAAIMLLLTAACGANSTVAAVDAEPASKDADYQMEDFSGELPMQGIGTPEGGEEATSPSIEEGEEVAGFPISVRMDRGFKDDYAGPLARIEPKEDASIALLYGEDGAALRIEKSRERGGLWLMAPRKGSLYVEGADNAAMFAGADGSVTNLLFEKEGYFYQVSFNRPDMRVSPEEALLFAKGIS